MDFNFQFKEFLSTFIVLFAIIDVVGSIPIFINLQEKKLSFSATRAAVYATVILVGFFFVGDWILSLFNVDVSSFAVAGSLVIFVVATEMTFGVEIFKNDGPKGSATIVPIVFPILAGPGAFTALLSLKAEYNQFNIMLGLLLNMVFVFLVLKYVGFFRKILGPGGIFVLRKFFGVILLAISVKLFMSNITHLLTN